MKIRNIRDRFWEKVQKTESCWIWKGCLDKDGYGQFSVRFKCFRAHRFSFFLVRGGIDTGLVIDHLCKNKNCVNPSHMELVTIRENSRRGNQAKISMEEAQKIREQYSTGVFSQRELGSKFGIGQDQISRIVTKNSRKTWIK